MKIFKKRAVKAAGAASARKPVRVPQGRISRRRKGKKRLLMKTYSTSSTLWLKFLEVFWFFGTFKVNAGALSANRVYLTSRWI
jgi:hypothetical protein